MMRLSHRDYDLLLDTILEIHDGASNGALLQRSGAALSRLIPCDHFAIFEATAKADPNGSGAFDLRAAWQTDDRLTVDLTRQMNLHFPSHPFTRAAQEIGTPVALRLSDFFSLRQLRNQAFFCEFYRPAGVDRCLAIAWPTSRGMSFLNANRCACDRDFSERDRRLMELVRPHFDQARRESDRLSVTRGLAATELRAHRLTPREIEVATWISQGKANAEIGIIAGMQSRTVEKHVERILVKLGVENRTAAALLIRGGNPS